MNEQMEFPVTFEDFAKEYGFKDNKEVYTNGSDLIPIFRVKQWLEHDNKLRAIETDTAYECGKHANYRGCTDCVLDKIREEIEELPTSRYTEAYRISFSADNFKKKVLEIFDKYKARK